MIITIHDGVATLTTKGATGVPVGEEYLHKVMVDTLFPETGLLPPVVRWHSRGKRYWLLERPPEDVIVHHHAAHPWQIANGDVKEHVFQLRTPWTLMAVDIDQTYFPVDVYLFATEGPITTDQAKLALMPLANLHRDGRVCLPSQVRLAEQPETIAEALSLAHRMVWMGGSNEDLGDAIDLIWARFRSLGPFMDKIRSEKTPRGRVSPLKVYQRWEEASPEQIMATNFPAVTSFGMLTAQLTMNERHSHQMGGKAWLNSIQSMFALAKGLEPPDEHEAAAAPKVIAVPEMPANWLQPLDENAATSTAHTTITFSGATFMNNAWIVHLPPDEEDPF